MQAQLRPPAPARRTTVLAAAGLALCGLAVYANSFSGPFLFDDLLSIPQNPTLRGLVSSLAPPGGGLTVSGRPILNLSFAVNRALSGDHVWSYHAANLLIHLLAGLTLFGIVRRTLGPGRSDAPGIAFAAALLWIVHPLQTESVTYIVQRAESLMGLLYLLTIYAFLRGAEGGTGGSAGAPLRARLWFGLSWAACLCGMGTKEVTVTAPVVVLLYDRTFLAGSFREAWRRRRGIHLALAATWIPLAGLVLQGGNRGGTAGFGVGVSFESYTATQFQAVAHYLRLAFWPHPLILDYGAQWVSSIGEVAPYAAWIALLAAATVAALVRRPALGFLGAAFFAILAPTSLVPGTRQTLAEHRMYLSLAPVMVLAVLALHAWLGRRSRFVVAAAAIGLGWATVRRNAVYRSDAAIWADTVAHRPGNAFAHNNYGNILAYAGRLDEAVEQYDEAVGLDPRYADAYYDDALTLTKLGRLPEAIGDYAQAARFNPNDAQVHRDLALTLARVGRLPEAIPEFERTLRLDPAQPDVRAKFGNALQAVGRTGEAIAQYERVLQSKPDDADTRNNLGISLLMGGRTPEAIAQFEWALRLDPNLPQVHLNLAAALASAGRSEEAAAQYETAKRLEAGRP